MVITATKRYITGANIGRIIEHKYNIDSWEEALKWAASLMEETSNYPFEIVKIKDDYGNSKTYGENED